MKFQLSNFIGFGGGDYHSQFVSLNKIHKNLFLDDFETNSEIDEDEYIDDDDLDFYDKRSKYSSSIETNSKYFKLNHLSMPLTDTIAQFVQDLSEDEFFINDLSFVFEMSRKRAISPYAIILALLYLKRLKRKSSLNTFGEEFSNKYGLSNSELCLIAILLASKYLTDEGESNELYNNDWAKICDIPVKKINNLEKMFLKKMEWDLYVSSDEFWSFTNDLTEKITRKKIKSQYNQCTYSDLDFLLRNSNEFSLDKIRNNIALLSKIILICSSTLIYITISSFFISSYLAYLRNQLINSFSLNDLSNGVSLNIENDQPEIIHLNDNNEIVKFDQDNTNLRSIQIGQDSLTKNQTLFKKEALCSKSYDKFRDISLKLYDIFEINKNIKELPTSINYELGKNYSGILPFHDHSTKKLINSGFNFITVNS